MKICNVKILLNFYYVFTHHILLMPIFHTFSIREFKEFIDNLLNDDTEYTITITDFNENDIDIVHMINRLPDNITIICI